MLKILLVSRNTSNFTDLISALKGYDDIELELSGSGEQALAVIPDREVDLAVSDEDLGDMTGLELVKRTLKINFMTNFAVVSGLSHDEFHEASEGLGIMLQLPGKPGSKEAKELVKTLKQIKGMYNQ